MSNKEGIADDVLALAQAIVDRDGVSVITTTDSYLLTFKVATLQKLLEQFKDKEKFAILVKKPDFAKTGN
jgi:hypothetical protein